MMRSSIANNGTHRLEACAEDLEESSFYDDSYQTPPAKKKGKKKNRKSFLNKAHQVEDEEEFSSHSSIVSSVGMEKWDRDTATPARRSSTYKNVGVELDNDETHRINRFRCLFLAVLLIITVTVATIVAVFLRKDEQDQFEAAFQSQSLRLLESLQSSLESQLSTLDAFAISIASLAAATNATWPFVTVPDFEQRASSILASTKSVSLAILPLVTDHQRSFWERYSVQQYPTWARQSLDFQQQQQEENGADNATTTTKADVPATVADDDNSMVMSPAIYSTADDTETPYYFPIWQHAPFMASSQQLGQDKEQPVENYNLAPLDWYKIGLEILLQEGMASMGSTFNLQEPLDPTMTTDPYLVTVASLIQQKWGMQEPFGFMMYPIRDIHQQHDHDHNSDNSNVVGAMIVYQHWRSLLLNILPPQASSMDVVLESVCNTIQSGDNNDNGASTTEQQHTDMFTYRINGQHADFVSAGDGHDPKFDHLQQSVSLVKGFQGNDRLQSGTEQYHGGAQLSDKNCNCNFRVYPTETMLAEYTTSAPIYYPIVVVGVFFVALLFFGLYDVAVEARQRTLMRNALKTNSIVTSLFPEEIANRMIEEEDVDGMMEKQLQPTTTMNSLQSSIVMLPQSMANLATGSSHTASTAASNLLKMTRGSIFPGTGANARTTNNNQSSSNLLRSSKLIRNGYMSNRQVLSSFLMLDGSNRSSSKASGDDDSSHTPRSRSAEKSSSQQQHHRQSLAELWPATTVMVTNIVGFTSWSSARDPGQVFHLLQTIYQAFDKQAKKKKVFKVETNADSYVAVTGLPQKQDDHAYRMARFATDCLNDFNELTLELEAELGPDTEELELRIGISSGPVTAGVLKGDRARFQLFGDTVNFARCLESTSEPNRIHISRTTAHLLETSGHEDLVVSRHGQVHIKGKGVVDTCYLVSSRANPKPSFFLPRRLSAGLSNATDQKVDRLVQWNVKILKGHLQKVVARRLVVKGISAIGNDQQEVTLPDRGDMTCLEEIEDVIAMPPFDPTVLEKEVDPMSVDLGPNALFQLNLFVQGIAALYLDNPFHNFQHASNVAMSVDKLLHRIVSPDIEESAAQSAAQHLHHFTHGITSDPLTHFTVVLSALIHDVDHRGISNAQLGKENPDMAEKYKNKSIAEQNSIDIAWDLLQSPAMCDLRACIYTDTDELTRFRQTLIKTVLATDIFDQELNDLRKKRWAMAFDKSKEVQSALQEVNVKATIVIEHLIQASDVSHTMQHWHIYRKWNERLFHEMYRSYRNGRSSNDPRTFWYNGEIGFFDNYIIPLAKKLKECQVFGVSSAEFLSYAMANRDEWQRKGQQIVEELVKQYEDSAFSDERQHDVDERPLEDKAGDDKMAENVEIDNAGTLSGSETDDNNTLPKQRIQRPGPEACEKQPKDGSQSEQKNNEDSRHNNVPAGHQEKDIGIETISTPPRSGGAQHKSPSPVISRLSKWLVNWEDKGPLGLLTVEFDADNQELQSGVDQDNAAPNGLSILKSDNDQEIDEREIKRSVEEYKGLHDIPLENDIEEANIIDTAAMDIGSDAGDSIHMLQDDDDRLEVSAGREPLEMLEEGICELQSELDALDKI